MGPRGWAQPAVAVPGGGGLRFGAHAHTPLLPGRRNRAHRARGVEQGRFGQVVGIGKGRLLAGHGAHAHALVDAEAAGLDDPFLQTPALGTGILEIEIGIIHPTRDHPAKDALEALCIETEGLEQESFGDRQQRYIRRSLDIGLDREDALQRWSRDIVEAAAATVFFTAQVLIIVACAGVFSWLLTVNQVPATLVAMLKGADVAAWQFLLAVNILLLAVGCFLDPLSSILLLTPLLAPIVKALGIDPVHFGIIVTVNLAIGLFHPPFGINIFVAQTVLGLKLETIYRGIIPFVIIYLIALGLITYIPDISLVGVRYLLAR